MPPAPEQPDFVLDTTAETVHHASHQKKSRGVVATKMQLNLTSMIDIIFQLQIYFLLTISFAIGEGIITANMPSGGQAESADKPPERPLNILLSASGAYGYRITIENVTEAPRDFLDLAESLKRLQNNPAKGYTGPYPPDNPVIIKPEGQVRWQHVVNAFNAAVVARYSNVSFAQPGDNNAEGGG